MNNGPNHLHGGEVGWNMLMWDAEPLETSDGPTVTFTRLSPHMEEGYPGNVKVKATYCLTHDNALRVVMEAETDQATPLNMAHHTYWNLSGHDSGSILQHHVQLESTKLTATDETLIPTGEIQDISSSCRDFSKGAKIGELTERMKHEEKEAWAATNGGFDFNYVVNSSGWGKLVPVATVHDPKSGRKMTLSSNQPGLQFYTASWIDPPLKGKGSATYDKYAGLCLETQNFPDAINKEENPAFPSAILRPGEVYNHIMVHQFSTD